MKLGKARKENAYIVSIGRPGLKAGQKELGTFR